MIEWQQLQIIKSDPFNIKYLVSKGYNPSENIQIEVIKRLDYSRINNNDIFVEKYIQSDVVKELYYRLKEVYSISK